MTFTSTLKHQVELICEFYAPSCLYQDGAEVERAVVEANLFALASHQYWGTWAFLQARWSPIEFDYLGYAKLRWDEYRRRKAEFIGTVKY